MENTCLYCDQSLIQNKSNTKIFCNRKCKDHYHIKNKPKPEPKQYSAVCKQCFKYFTFIFRGGSKSNFCCRKCYELYYYRHKRDKKKLHEIWTKWRKRNKERYNAWCREYKRNRVKQLKLKEEQLQKETELRSIKIDAIQERDRRERQQKTLAKLRMAFAQGVVTNRL